MQKVKIISLVIFLGILGLGFYMYTWEFRKPTLEVYFFNLPRGRAIFFRTPHGQTILIDGGQTSEIMRELTKVFPFYRRRIDAVIVTSPQPKNIGGLVEVSGRYDIGKVIESSLMGTSSAREAFEKVIHEKKVPIEKMEKGSEFEVDGLQFKILNDDPELALQVDYESKSFILLGDISKKIQKSLAPEMGKATLVEFAHSAADSRVSSELFAALNPDHIVFSKKESTRAPSKTKKKFDIDMIDTSRLINLSKEGTVRLVY